MFDLFLLIKGVVLWRFSESFGFVVLLTKDISGEGFRFGFDLLEMFRWIALQNT